MEDRGSRVKRRGPLAADDGAGCASGDGLISTLTREQIKDATGSTAG